MFISTRYFVILVKDKEKAKEVFKKIEKFLIETLKLELNKKSKYYPSKKGCDFCGYIIHEDYALLRKRNKKTIIKKIKIWNNLYEQENLDIKKVEMSIASFIGHIKYADSYHFKNKCFNKMKFKSSYNINCKIKSYNFKIFMTF